ncbi:hypothetical protein GCM10009716_32670 [Streptomyces sodiiphilus]|uniref:Helix-turn-helix domain-containing protein n=1 Tax=Streptomyces sodiiphilus TaxID=226217 RepID=A0ABP5ASH7_9ACTN
MTVSDIGIGLDKRSELVYRRLLLAPRWKPEQLSRDIGWPESEIHKIVEGLRRDGLAGRSGDTTGAVRAVEPCVALPALLAKRMREPGAKQPGPVEVERFITLHERAAERLGPVTTGDSHDEISTMVERMITKVERTVTFLVSALPDGPDGVVEGAPEFSRALADMALRRGAALRSVWSGTVLRSPAVHSHAEWLAGQSAPPRSAAAVPLHGMVMDGQVAVLVDVGRVRVVRAPAELERLTSLADLLWERGTPVRQATVRHAGAPAARRPRYEVVLRLLAEGHTDDAIARRPGCSVRTVRNDVASAGGPLPSRRRVPCLPRVQ